MLVDLRTSLLKVIDMKPKSLLALMSFIFLLSVPVMGGLTNYQQGMYAGLKAGIMMGKLLGASPYDSSRAQEFNAQVDAFNQGLAGAFGNNQTAINAFWLTPYGNNQISESWNRTAMTNALVTVPTSGEGQGNRDVF